LFLSFALTSSVETRADTMSFHFLLPPMSARYGSYQRNPPPRSLCWMRKPKRTLTSYWMRKWRRL